MGIFYTDKNGQVWVLEATPHGVGTFIWGKQYYYCFQMI